MLVRSLQRNCEQIAGKNVDCRQNVCETVRRREWTISNMSSGPRTGRRFSVTVDVTAVLFQFLISCNFHVRLVLFELYKLGSVSNIFYEVQTTFSSNLRVLVRGCYVRFLLSSRYSLQERLAAYETLVPCDQKLPIQDTVYNL